MNNQSSMNLSLLLVGICILYYAGGGNMMELMTNKDLCKSKFQNKINLANKNIKKAKSEITNISNKITSLNTEIENLKDDVSERQVEHRRAKDDLHYNTKMKNTINTEIVTCYNNTNNNNKNNTNNNTMF